MTWTPHKPSDWPFRFATLNERTRLRDWPDHKRDQRGEPILECRWVPAGTKVRVVMVSRFGDVGITDDLTAETGYLARILVEKLTECER